MFMGDLKFIGMVVGTFFTRPKDPTTVYTIDIDRDIEIDR